MKQQTKNKNEITIIYVIYLPINVLQIKSKEIKKFDGKIKQQQKMLYTIFKDEHNVFGCKI